MRFQPGDIVVNRFSDKLARVVGIAKVDENEVVWYRAHRINDPDFHFLMTRRDYRTVLETVNSARFAYDEIEKSNIMETDYEQWEFEMADWGASYGHAILQLIELQTKGEAE
jgi:hypothetical protein